MGCDPDLSFTGLAGHADVLWQIRETFGPNFADTLVALSLRATVDDPLYGYDEDEGVYLGRKLKEIDSVVDDGTKWPKILDILREAGIPVERI
jgi:hypothetical protein